MYAFSTESNWRKSYGQDIKSVSEEELVWWFDVFIWDGTRGSTGGAIHRWWMMNNVDHDICIMNAMYTFAGTKLTQYSSWTVTIHSQNKVTPTTIHVPNMSTF